MSATDTLGSGLRDHFDAVADRRVPPGFQDAVRRRAMEVGRRRSVGAQLGLPGPGGGVGTAWRPARLLVAFALLLVALLLATGTFVVGRRLLEQTSTRIPTATLEVVGSMVEARADAAAVRLADGRVLVIGGRGLDASGEPRALDSVEAFDPDTGTWELVGALAEPRVGAAAALLRDGRVLVTGGADGPSWNVPPPGATTAEIWDPAIHRLEPTGPMLQGRAWHTATALRDGRVLVVGGMGELVPGADPRQFEVGGLEPGATPSMGSLRSTELWDPTTGSFTATGSMSDTRYQHAALPRQGGVLVSGGASFAAVATPDGGTGGGRGISSIELWMAPDGTFEWITSSPDGGLNRGVTLPDGTSVICCASGADEAKVVVYPADDDAPSWLRVPQAWTGGDIVALFDGRVMNAWSNGVSGWGVEILEVGSGVVSSVLGEGPSPIAGPDPEAARPGWHDGGVMTVLDDGRVLMAGGLVEGSHGSLEPIDDTSVVRVSP